MLNWLFGCVTEQKNLYITAEAFSELTDERFLYKVYGDGELKEKYAAAAAHALQAVETTLCMICVLLRWKAAKM